MDFASLLDDMLLLALVISGAWILGKRSKRIKKEAGVSRANMASTSLKFGLSSAVLTVAAVLLWIRKDSLFESAGEMQGEFQVVSLFLAFWGSLLTGAVGIILGLLVLVRKTQGQNAATAGTLLGLSPLLFLNYVLLFVGWDNFVTYFP